MGFANLGFVKELASAPRVVERGLFVWVFLSVSGGFLAVKCARNNLRPFRIHFDDPKTLLYRILGGTLFLNFYAEGPCKKNIKKWHESEHWQKWFFAYFRGLLRDIRLAFCMQYLQLVDYKYKKKKLLGREKWKIYPRGMCLQKNRCICTRGISNID